MAFVFTLNKLKNGDTQINISEATRIPGTNKQRRNTIEKYHFSELQAKGYDPIIFIKQRINELKAQNKSNKELQTYKINFDEELELSPSLTTDFNSNDLSINLGYAVYCKLYHILNLDELINSRRQHVNATFNINVLFQHLIYSRLLFPDSKLGTWENRHIFYGHTDYDLQHVYRSMDYILRWRTDILTTIDKSIRKNFNRKGYIIFYDVTNYFFEVDSSDDETGLRAKGVSKEHRPLPIIQLGLFMDELGLPITYELFRGNTNDSVTMHEAMDTSIIDFSDSRKIVVADKGMMSYYNILKIREARNGYVISQSIRKSDEDTKTYALSEEGWQVYTEKNGEVIYKIKERIIPRKISTYGDVDSKKHSGTYNERQIFIWSAKYEERAKRDRQEALEKALQYEGTKSTNSKDSTYGRLKYVKKVPIKDGNEVEAEKYLVTFDMDALIEEEKYDGYYIICTNVIGVENEKDIRKDKDTNWAYYREKDGFLVLNHIVPATEIVDIYGGLWKIEETFKVSKTGMLKFRPVFHSKQERIRAHFLMCFVSLVIERLLEYKMNWEYSGSSIQKSLSNFNAVQLIDSNIYQISYYDNLIAKILSKMEIKFSTKFITQEDLRKIIGDTKK
jgi:transposase